MSRFWISLIVLSLVFYYGCGPEEEEEGAEEIVEIKIIFQIPPALAPSLTISTVTVTVTAGPDDATVLASKGLEIQDKIATGKLSVRAGEDRVFTVEAKDKSGFVVGFGTKTVDVIAGRETTVVIPIRQTGDVTIKAEFEPQEEIIPGVGAAGVELLEPFSKARDLYGEPDDVEYSPEIESHFFLYRDIGLSGAVPDIDEDKVLDDDEPILFLGIGDPYKGTTSGGNGIGSLREEVEKEFGPPEKCTPYEQGELRCEYPSKGIDFMYDNSSKVVLIFIYIKS